MVRGSISARRRLAGYALALVGAPALVAVLVPVRDRLDLASDALLFMLLVVGTALVGGLGPALLASAWSAALLNFFFTEPFHTFRVHEDTDVVAVLVFTAISLMVSWVVDLAARRASAVREAAELEAGNRLRTALLAAVGHDLRTPLATAKAVVSGLRSPDVVLDEADRDELLAAADEALDTLSALVYNLLDLSRLQAAPCRCAPVRSRWGTWWRPHSTTSGCAIVRSWSTSPTSCPTSSPIPGCSNVCWSTSWPTPSGSPPTLPPSGPRARAHRIVLRVVDNGPGIDASDRQRVFVPFQRLGDTTPTGLGLGLALSRGLVEAMAGSLDLHDTPGGGLTVVISLPAVTAPASREVLAP